MLQREEESQSALKALYIMVKKEDLLMSKMFQAFSCGDSLWLGVVSRSVVASQCSFSLCRLKFDCN